MSEPVLSRIQALASRVCGLVHSRRLDDDFAQELDSHLVMLTEENIRKGMSPEDAKRAARLKLGSDASLRETHHDQRTFPWLESVAQDVRFALRMLRKNPGFTAAAVLTLALGIGANTAIFSVVDAALFRPLPFSNPDRLVQVWENERAPGQYPFSGPDYLDWEAQNRTLQASTLYSFAKAYNASGIDQTESAFVVSAQANFFSVLGVPPQLGRAFAAGDDEAGRSRIAVLSYGFWQRHFGRGSDALGKTIQLNNEAYIVTGVMPQSFNFPAATDVWIPVDMSAVEKSPRGSHMWRTIGRLRPGYTPPQAEADLAAIAKSYPGTNNSTGGFVVPLKDQITKGSKLGLLLLLGAVSLLLMIACANTANLLLARASGRQREMAVRAALGASRFRMMRQVLTESFLLAIGGSAVGLATAGCAVALLRPTGVPSGQRTNAVASMLPLVNPLQIDGRVLIFTTAATHLVTILFGLAPALQISALNVYEELKSGARSILSSSKKRSLLRECLVVSEVAMSLALLVGAGLFLKTLANLRSTNIGIQTDRVLTFGVALPSSSYGTAEKKREFFDRAIEQIDHIPGVTTTAVASELPVEGGNNGYITVGSVPDPDLAQQLVEWNYVTPNYFRAMGIGFLQGDNFSSDSTDWAFHAIQEADSLYKAGKLGPSAQLPPDLSFTAVISRQMARTYWPNQDPVGKIFKIWGIIPTRVIGVVSDVKEWGVTQRPIPQVYFPVTQDLDDISAKFVVKTQLAPLSVAPAIREKIAALDDSIALAQVRTMEQVVGQSIQNTATEATLLAAFSALGLVLAAIGVYGVMAYLVAQRTHEIGVRIALGAQRRDVLRLVLFRGAGLALIGLAAGAAIALALARATGSLLYGVRPTDPLTFGTSAFFLLSVAIAACWIPARRAMRVDPMVALRNE
ncbi:MAG TPA: ABC transporter permease [Candidatus Acidoferrales bacterium]|nr:ABC transporter permease [Candidatus Acidoferrales bacterium]